MKLKYADYITEKTTGETTETLIKYLQDKEIIGEETEDGWYVINTVKLMGSKQPYGNGTDGKTDVYVLEKKTETGMREGKKIASTAPIKIAENEETDPSEIYEVVYYGKSSTDEVNLGVLVNDKMQEDGNKVKFYLSYRGAGRGYYGYGSTSGGSTSEKIELETEPGKTWLDWANETYTNDKDISDINTIRKFIKNLKNTQGDDAEMTGSLFCGERNDENGGYFRYGEYYITIENTKISDAIRNGETYYYTMTWRGLCP